MRAQKPREFDVLRLDSNNDCNVHCVYCHNHRSKDLVDAADFHAFLEHNVISLDNFQMGCIMEPTLGQRMCDLMLLVAGSRVRPGDKFILQTNGILLHRHDQGKMRDVRLTHLYVSIDAADPATHKTLRGGTSLAKVVSNLAAVGTFCPDTEIVFITTVTSININAVERLVVFGLDLGVRKFVLREIFYWRNSSVVDHSRMPTLLLGENDFARMRERLLAKFSKHVEFEFADNATLDRNAERMNADSLR
jgi:MoaA/NifB/PqqE/SkfB family radical SAM enzyme